ncbi:MAG: type II toxin-antitoxin system RelE/ParE family toxin, partial [Nitrospinae bacterium]|nr:type II toxin-antitoxin system RelE/ParE family toxin [Nitrospinota bacterium]
MTLFYELSAAADSDLDEIFDYTAHEFGMDQAVKYVSDFDEVFERLSQNPQSGLDRKEIRSGLRSFIKDKHVVFYRILKDRVRVVRILH